MATLVWCEGGTRYRSQVTDLVVRLEAPRRVAFDYTHEGESYTLSFDPNPSGELMAVDREGTVYLGRFTEDASQFVGSYRGAYSGDFELTFP